MIDEILKFNRRFVEDHGYERYVTTKYLYKKVAVVTYTDIRLTELLPATLDLKNGDAKIIKNVGRIILKPFSSKIRSLLVGIYELGVGT